MRMQRSVGAALSIALGLTVSLSAHSLAASSAAAEGPGSKSAGAAKELTQQLDQAKLQHIATRDPEDPTRFIAAMYFPGMQIVTVSGKYSVPVLLNEKLMAKNYKDVYIDLSSASERDSRITIEDLRADGFPVIRVKGATSGDAWEAGTARVVFDFDWKKQKLTEKDFYDKLQTADAQYARMLGLLLAEAKK